MDLNNNSKNDSYRDDLSKNIFKCMEQNNSSDAHDRNKEDLSENISSKENKLLTRLETVVENKESK